MEKTIEQLKIAVLAGGIGSEREANSISAMSVGAQPSAPAVISQLPEIRLLW